MNIVTAGKILENLSKFNFNLYSSSLFTSIQLTYIVVCRGLILSIQTAPQLHQCNPNQPCFTLAAQ